MTITKSKPFYAVAGAGDLAVKKLREVPARLTTFKVDRKDIESALASIQVETKALPGRAQSVALGLAGEVAGRADAAYGELVGRGRRIVTRVRRQQATQDLQSSAGTTVRRTKTATRSAKKAASDTRSAARGTATTARKRSTDATKAVKSATTSARETADAATKAASDGADKVGH